MNDVVTTRAHSFLIGSSSFLQATSKPLIFQMGLKFSSIRPGTYELPALSVWKNPYRCNGKNVATTLVLSILNGSSSFLHTIRTTLDEFEFCQVPITCFGVSSP